LNNSLIQNYDNYLIILNNLKEKMKKIGNMHNSYKGLSLYSVPSPELQKALLHHFIIIYGEISLLVINNYTYKWYNKKIFNKLNKLIIYINNSHFISVRKDVNNNYLLLDTARYEDNYSKNKSNDLLYNNLINNIVHDDNTIQQTIYKGGCDVMSFTNYLLDNNKYASINDGEKLRSYLGEIIYNKIKNGKTPIDLENEFNEYIKRYENI